MDISIHIIYYYDSVLSSFRSHFAFYTYKHTLFIFWENDCNVQQYMVVPIQFARTDGTQSTYKPQSSLLLSTDMVGNNHHLSNLLISTIETINISNQKYRIVTCPSEFECCQIVVRVQLCLLMCSSRSSFIYLFVVYYSTISVCSQIPLCYFTFRCLGVLFQKVTIQPSFWLIWITWNCSDEDR